MRKISCIVGVVAVVLAAGCYRQDVRTVVVDVPQLKSADCARMIQDAVKTNLPDGIKAVVPDLEKRQVHVTYEALKLGIKNIEHAIAAGGFDANATPGAADARARLPEGCR